MKSVNPSYLKYITENNFLDYTYRVEITNDNTKEVTRYDGNVIQSFEINGTESSSGFAIGNTLSMQLSLSLLLEERTEIPTNSIVKPYIRYSWNDLSEEMCMGIFYVNSVDIDHKHKISIKASDAMSATELLGGVYTDPNVEPPMNSKFLVKDMIGKFPGQLSVNEDAIPSIEINTLMFNEHIVGKTFREVLGYIAAVDGGFARVNYTNEGLSEIQFTTYKKVDGLVLTMINDDYSKIKTVKSGKNKFTLKQIATEIYVKNEEADVEQKEDASAYSSATVTSGDKNAKPYELVTFNCPIIASSLSNLKALDRVFELVKDVEYYPVDATLFGYHFLECGDIVTIENTYGELLDLYIQDIKINVVGGVMVTVSSKYDYTKSTPLKNSVTARVDSLTKQVETFASRFEVTNEKIDMAVSKAEIETVIQENLETLNMGVNSWIREVYNMDGAVDDVTKPSAVHFQGKQAIISDIFKDPEFPHLTEFEGARTVRYATCVKVVERTTIGVMVKQISKELNYLPSLDNVAVYVNSQQAKAIELKTVDSQPVEGTENSGYYTYNAILNAGWNVIEVLHYEPIGSTVDVKCGVIEVDDITVEEVIVNVDNLDTVEVFSKSPVIDLVNCNALSINYTRFVGAEFTIESDSIKQIVTEIKDTQTNIGSLEVSFDKIAARVESTEESIDGLNEKYTEISNTADEIRLAAGKVNEFETKLNDNESAIKRIEQSADLYVKHDEIGSVVKEEAGLMIGDIELNYVQKSELAQTKNDITMTFSQSGGYNLLQETAFYNNDKINTPDGPWKLVSGDKKLLFRCITFDENQDKAYPDSNANTLYAYDLPVQADGTETYLEQEVALTRGKKYTFSVLFSSQDTLKWKEIGLDIFADGNWTKDVVWQYPSGEENITSVAKHMGTGGKDVNDWTKVSKTFSLSSPTNESDSTEKVKIRLVFREYNVDADLSIVHPLLIEGELDMVYSPNANEMYTGITRINKDGIKISRSDSTTSTSIDHMGVSIVNDEAVLAEFKSTNAYMPVARIDEVVDSPIPSKRSLMDTLIVDSTKEPSKTTFRTLQECFNSIPDITTSNITIEVHSNTNGGYIKDISGSPIEIILKENVQIGSPIILSNISNAVNIHSESQIFSDSNYKYGYVRGIACANCHNVTISYLHLDELAYPTLINDLGIGIDAYTNISTAIILEHSDATVKYCNVLKTINQSKDGVDFSCVIAARNSRCIAFNIRGNDAKNIYVRYIYVSLGYSHLYIARHTSLLLDTNDGIDTSTVINVLPVNIRLIKFPNNEANLTTFTNREYEADSDLASAFPPDSRLPGSDTSSPQYGEITELETIYAKSRVQQSRYFDAPTSKYIVNKTTNGGSQVGTLYRNNLYYYDRTIFEFDPERFRSALQGAQSKVYDEEGNPIEGQTPLTASLIIVAESIGEYSPRPEYPDDKYVPVNISMYSDLEYAYDTSERKTADPKFNEGISGKYDYVPNNVETDNTIYLDDNDANWNYDNHGFYPGHMTIEIPLKFYMTGLENPLSKNYRNGTEDMKNGRVRYVVVDTGIYALDEKGGNIQSDTASVKLTNAYFKISYNINLGSTSPEEGEEETVFYVPDYSEDPDYANEYQQWCQERGLIYNLSNTYDDNIVNGGFVRCLPAIGSPIYVGETLTVFRSKGKDPDKIPLTVPDFTKNSSFESDYRTWCTENEVLLSVLEQYSSTVASGGFISCSPVPGSTIYRGDVLTITKSKGKKPVTCNGAPKEDDVFPVFQKRYIDQETGETLITTVEYDNDVPGDGYIFACQPYFENEFIPETYTHSDHYRSTYKFIENDFIDLLKNADSGSIKASIIVNAGSYSDVVWLIDSASDPYHRQCPFKVDIHNSLSTVRDDPNDITGDNITSMLVRGDSRNVFTIEKDVTKRGREIPIEFKTNGEKEFKNGTLKYLTIEPYTGYQRDAFGFRNSWSMSYGAHFNHTVFIRVAYTENGVKKEGHIYPVYGYSRARAIKCLVDDTINQTVTYAGGTNDLELAFYDQYFNGIDESKYSPVTQTTNSNLVSIEMEESSCLLKQTIFKFDTNDFKKYLPSDFATGEYTLHLYVEIESIEKPWTHVTDNLGNTRLMGALTFAPFTNLEDIHCRMLPSTSRAHDDYELNGLIVNDTGEVLSEQFFEESYIDYQPIVTNANEYGLSVKEGYYVPDAGYDALSIKIPAKLLSGCIRYIVVRPNYAYYSHTLKIRNVFLVVEDIGMHVSSTAYEPAVLSIEPWYLDEE